MMAASEVRLLAVCAAAQLMLSGPVYTVCIFSPLPLPQTHPPPPPSPPPPPPPPAPPPLLLPPFSTKPFSAYNPISLPLVTQSTLGLFETPALMCVVTGQASYVN